MELAEATNCYKVIRVIHLFAHVSTIPHLGKLTIMPGDLELDASHGNIWNIYQRAASPSCGAGFAGQNTASFGPLKAINDKGTWSRFPRGREQRPLPGSGALPQPRVVSTAKLRARVLDDMLGKVSRYRLTFKILRGLQAFESGSWCTQCSTGNSE
jgi:hypothetical protein